jgi:hypothetical protein
MNENGMTRLLEMRISGRKPRDRPRTRYIDKVMGDVERRGAEDIQE